MNGVQITLLVVGGLGLLVAFGGSALAEARFAWEHRRPKSCGRGRHEWGIPFTTYSRQDHEYGTATRCVRCGREW